MNERIKQLAKKSGAKVHREQTRNGDWVDFSDYTGFNYEKFANLIIQECSTLADEHFGSAHFGMGVSGTMIKKHFGVE